MQVALARWKFRFWFVGLCASGFERRDRLFRCRRRSQASTQNRCLCSLLGSELLFWQRDMSSRRKVERGLSGHSRWRLLLIRSHMHVSDEA